MADFPVEPVVTDFSVAELERHRDRPSLVTLFLSGVESSALDLDDPTYLEFEYMQHFRCAVDAVFPPKQPLKALHLGGAGCAFARALDALRPGSRQLAIEIDRRLAEYARQWFDLPRSPRLRIRVEDARHTLDTINPAWDVIIRDAFQGVEVPSHLRTVESAREAARILAPGGVYLLNSIASAGLNRLNAEAAALFTAFKYVTAITDPAILRGRRFGNIVLVASNDELPLYELERKVHSLPLPTRLVDPEDLRARARGAQPARDAEVGWVPGAHP
ncbi:spermidine synthase [Actinobaculum suis]|uniref:Spermidine synthase n=1 Tax=Actinobaculum suis TaxID=1657 RepID=A0A7Z8Y9Y2_9ACTO|nr:fused MFS/spermidine synthase [Actinobaculum suis]VDG76756.1 spermidine synthase [Actinobaculum suis]